MGLRTTRQVAELLGVPFYRVRYLLDAGKVPRPRRNASGRHEWTEAMIQQAKTILEAEFGKAVPS